MIHPLLVEAIPDGVIVATVVIAFLAALVFSGPTAPREDPEEDQ